MELTNHSSLMIAEDAGSGTWLLHDSGEQPPTPVNLPGSLDLRAVADRLFASACTPWTRILVLVTADGDPEPKLIASQPYLVWQVTKAQSLAYVAPSQWSKFFVVQGTDPPHVSLLIRSRKGFVECAFSGNLQARLPESLGITKCLVESGSAQLAQDLQSRFRMEVQVAAPGAILEGARAYACERMLETGVWIHAGARFTMRNERAIEYSVLHPELPVFDLNEPALANAVGQRPVLVVADAIVSELYSCPWRPYANRHFRSWNEFILEAGEGAKTLDGVTSVCAKAAELSVPRNAVLVGVGGGSLLDIAGLAAALLRRGVGFIRVPTTLVGLVDVAVGVKQAVNAFGKKNFLGAFYPPIASINDYRFTSTLPHSAVACGLAEIAKMALIRDEPMFELVTKYARELLLSRFVRPRGVAKQIALRSEFLMMEELSTNLFEADLARIVDFGHTFSPAIESHSSFRIPHGAAVAIDMLLSTAIAVTRSLAEPALLHRLVGLTRDLGLLPTSEELPEPDFLQAALDEARQHRGGALNLVVVQRVAHPMFLQELRQSDLRSARRLLVSYLKSHDTKFAWHQDECVNF